LQKRNLGAALIAFTLVCIGYGCTKLDTTTLGSDLITVDNINTFKDKFDVVTTQGVYQNGSDSTIMLKTANHALGDISSMSDPQFGKTEASIYLQFKPSFFPFYFGIAGDRIKDTVGVGLDSVVLCLSYKGIWGDSSNAHIPQKFEVREIINTVFKDKPDTLWGLNFKPDVNSDLLSDNLASIAYTPALAARKTVYGKGKDSGEVDNQIRIRLDTTKALIRSLYYTQDSTTNGTNNGYLSEEKFRNKFFGFEVKAVGPSGNALYYVNLAETKTRLEFHFRKRKNAVIDTVMQAFPFFSAPVTNFGIAKASSSANYIKRTLSPVITTGTALNEVYIQAAPGTFATVSIPGLNAYRNSKDKIIHKATLIIEQKDNLPAVPVFTPPSFLYLDLKDSVTAIPPAVQKYLPVFFDLSPGANYFPNSLDAQNYHPYPFANNVDINSFGGNAITTSDATGTYIRYEFNLTRYIQHIVKANYYNYDLRIFAPYNYFYPQYDNKYVIPFFNQVGLGRVMLGAGDTTPNKPRKMRLEVVYSKIKP
jgi:hypothetical protein